MYGLKYNSNLVAFIAIVICYAKVIKKTELVR